MREPISLEGLLRTFAGHWRWLALACATAAVLAGGFSLSLPRQYTAVSRLILETEPRSPLQEAAAENPQLLARLAGYEQLVRSDALFEEVARAASLDPVRPLEEWKSAGLATRLLPAARVIEVRFTHTDARVAHQVALGLAQGAAGRSVEARRESAAALATELEQVPSETRQWAGLRGDSLRLLDAGIVPSVASSPRVLLNVMSAALLALSLAGAFVILRFLLAARP